MSTVVKDLGAVSAYAYAVEKGYTGTEAEFAELMADYANVGQRAENAADSALESKSAAQTAAQTATNKASEATTAAQTATTKAQEAQTSAQTASSKASEASQSASQASGYAQTAETAKTDAQTAKTQAETARDNAVTAKTAAETAQGKAEDAQVAAESVAESIPSDYSQMSEDVSELKEELTTSLDSYDVRIIEPNYSSGVMNESGVVSASDSYKYTADKIPVKSGDVVIIYRENMSYDTFQNELSGTAGYIMRFVTAFNGDTVVSASGMVGGFNYVVPNGIDGIIVSVYTRNSTEQYDQKIRVQSAVTEVVPKTFGILDGKKWCACGDSFTEAGYGGNDADLSYYTFTTGRFAGQRKTYPWIIGLRNNMDIANIAKSGMSMANSSGSNAFVLDDYYKNIPSDSDYITLKFGINDLNHGSQLGTIDSTDPTTFYGAWNIVMDYITTNFSYAKVGIIVSNGMSSNFTFADATIAIAKKWGIPYLDEVYDPKVPLLHRVNRPDVCADVLQRKLEAFRVSASNTHPNVNAQYYEAAFVEDWLRTL